MSRRCSRRWAAIAAKRADIGKLLFRGPMVEGSAGLPAEAATEVQIGLVQQFGALGEQPAVGTLAAETVHATPPIGAIAAAWPTSSATKARNATTSPERATSRSWPR